MNLVRPSYNTNKNGEKKLKKAPSATGSENKSTNENKKSKLKSWKIDFFRDQDRDKMDFLKRKLLKMRKKTKSSSNVRKIISSQSKVSSSNNKSTVNKVTNRKNSKKNPYTIVSKPYTMRLTFDFIEKINKNQVLTRVLRFCWTVSNRF